LTVSQMLLQLCQERENVALHGAFAVLDILATLQNVFGG
jgi:hypothetical protein